MPCLLSDVCIVRRFLTSSFLKTWNWQIQLRITRLALPLQHNQQETIERGWYTILKIKLHHYDMHDKSNARLIFFC